MSEAEEQAWQKHKTAWPLEAGVEPMNHEFAFRMGYRAAQAVSLPDRDAVNELQSWLNEPTGKNEFYVNGFPTRYDSLADLYSDEFAEKLRTLVAALSTQPAAVDCEGTCDYYGGVCVTCGRAQPTELAELFPGTLAALDRLTIRPEVQS